MAVMVVPIHSVHMHTIINNLNPGINFIFFDQENRFIIPKSDFVLIGQLVWRDKVGLNRQNLERSLMLGEQVSLLCIVYTTLLLKEASVCERNLCGFLKNSQKCIATKN